MSDISRNWKRTRADGEHVRYYKMVLLLRYVYFKVYSDKIPKTNFEENNQFLYFLPCRYKSLIFRAQMQLGNPYRSWQVFDNLKFHWKLSNFWFSNIKSNSQFLKLHLHDFWLIAGICENYLCNEPFFYVYLPIKFEIFSILFFIVNVSRAENKQDYCD